MKRWSLKLKVSVYCTLLTVLGLVGTAAMILPRVYNNELHALDDQLGDNAKEVYDDLDGKLRAGGKLLRPMTIKNIPFSLQRRYIVIESSSGEELYRTKVAPSRDAETEPSWIDWVFGRDRSPGKNFKDLNLHALGDEPFTVRIGRANARFVTAYHGPLKIWMGTRLGTLEKVQDELLVNFLEVIPAITGLVFIGAIFLARHSLRPVTAMTAAAERISAQSPDERLPQPHAADEIARLTVVLNESFDRLQRAYRSAARFSADASHQLKTPIAVLRAGLDELRRCEDLAPQDQETVNILMQQTRRLTTLVEDLLLLAQADAGRLELDAASVDLAPLLAMVLDDTQALGEERGLIITLDSPEQLYARADPRRVKIILQNLTENAVKYNREGGRIRLSARREGASIIVSIANTGSTISEPHRDELFDRFSRAGMGENIKGHGLGLNIARELARAHGGDLRLLRSDGEWTEFAVKLPASEPPASQPADILQTATA